MKRRLFHKSALLILASLVLGAAPASYAQESLPAGMKVASVEAEPSSVALTHPYAYRQILLMGQLQTGERVDLTRMAQVTADAKLVKISPTGLIRPVADGIGAIKFMVAGHTLTVPVSVSGQKKEYPVSFVGDVMPTLSKIGCNAGTCHGAQQGKNGFKLSLRGYDPLFDHIALTDDLEGRRFNRADPERSLMLMKPSGAAPHVGGVVMLPGDPNYELVRRWI